MRILVCGGRDFTDYNFIRDNLNRIMKEKGCYGVHGPIDSPDPITLIHGKAKGVDLLADKWAVHNYLRIEEFPAEWDKHGRSAGSIRNSRMLRVGQPDIVIAFPGGKGTANMIAQARKVGIPVEIVEL